MGGHQFMQDWESAPILSPDPGPPVSGDSSQMVRTLINIDRWRQPPSVSASSVAAAAANAEISDISALLNSKSVKGVGQKMAATLVAQFGERTLIVLRGLGSEEEQKKLDATPNLGPVTLKKIRGSVETWETLREALRFCRSLSLLSETQIASVVSTHSDRSEAVLRRNPYLLLDLFPSLRFASVDAVARGDVLLFPPDSPERARAVIHHNLRRAVGNGHCCVPQVICASGLKPAGPKRASLLRCSVAALFLCCAACQTISALTLL